MKQTASFALQKAIYQRAGVVTGKAVYDAVPENAPFPYLVIGDDTVSDESGKLVSIESIESQVFIYSQYPGYAEAKAIADQLVQGVTPQTLDLSGDGFKVLLVNVLGYSTGKVDAKTRQLVVRFQVKVSKKEA